LGAFLAEQVPASIPSIVAAMVPGAGPALSAEVKALQAAAQAATTVAAKQAAEKALGVAVSNATKSAIKRGTTASVATGAVQQGTDVGVDTFKQNYDYLIKQGVPAEEAAAQVINKARAAGVSGAIISLLAQKLPGAQAMERALAGEKGKVGRVAGAVLGAVKESPGEIGEEVGGKFTQNLAAREFNPEQSLTEGLGQTAGAAALGGGFMGGTIGALQGGTSAEAPPTQPAPPQQPAKTEQTPEQKAQILRPFEEVEKAEIEQITQDLLKQNFPEDSARRIAAKRVIENRKQQIKDAILEPAQNEIEQRVKELIDTGVDPKLALIQAPQQIAAEKEADALAQSETQGETNVRQPITETAGTSNEVAGATDQGVAAAGAEGAQRDGVVSTESDAGQPAVREAAQPPAVESKNNFVVERKSGYRGGTSEKVEWVLRRKSDNQIIGHYPRKKDAEQMLDIYTLPKEEVFAKHPELKPPAETTTTPTEVVKEQPPVELSREEKLKTATDAELEEALTKIGGSDISFLSVPEIQAEIDRRKAEAEATTKKKETRGRKALPAEQKAVKETQRKAGRKDYTTAANRFSKNKNNLQAQLEKANEPLDEGEFEDEDALAQAQEDKRAKKAYVINQLLDIEQAHRGSPLGKEVKKVLDDRTKITQQELDKVKQGREVRRKTDLQDLRGTSSKGASPLASRVKVGNLMTDLAKPRTGLKH